MDKRKRKAFFKPIAEEHYARMRFHAGALQKQYVEQLKAGCPPDAAGWLDALLVDHYALMGHVAAAAEIDNPAKASHQSGWMTPARKLLIVKVALDSPDKEGPALITHILNKLEDWASNEDEYSEDGRVDGELLQVLQGELNEDSLRKAIKRVLEDAGV